MTATTTNGPARRKQLSDQLDRLDNIIDGLCDGLPQAVAEATREGARQAVRDVILELLANPDLRALIGGAAPPPAPEPAAPRAGFWDRVGAGLSAAKVAVADRCRAAAAAVASAAQTLAAAVPMRQVLLAGAGIGAVGLLGSAGRRALAAVAGAVRQASAAAAVVGFQPWPVADADLTSDGRWLATTSPRPDGGTEIVVREVAAGSPGRVTLWVPEVGPELGGRPRVGLSPDGRFAASHVGGVIRRWGLGGEPKWWPDAQPRELTTGPADDPTGQAGPTRGVSFTPSGALWVWEVDRVRGWPGGRPVAIPSDVQLTSFAAADDVVLAGRADGSVARYAPDGTPVGTDRVAPAAVTGLARSGDLAGC